MPLPRISLPRRCRLIALLSVVFLLPVCVSSSPARADAPAPSADQLAAEKADGYVPLFDGKTLDGWDGNPDFWRVEDGAITGETTAEKPTKGSTFLIWRGGETADFELKLQDRLRNHNSGIQYRSFEVPGQKWVIGGYQADFEGGDRYSGILYGEKFRGILAPRGKRTELVRDKDGKFSVVPVEDLGDSAELQQAIDKEGWNDYHITARGFDFQHRINGQLMSACRDLDEKMRRTRGLLALQLHAGPAMKVQFRYIRMKKLPPKKAAADSNDSAAASDDGKTRKVVFIAGRRSHGYGAHEHRAGCLLLARGLQDSGLPVETRVITEGWPEDSSVLSDADAVVIYADGGGRHPFNSHLDEIDALMKQGTGLVCIHYGVEVPKGDSGNAFLDWIGGYFETHWSVNPHWTPGFTKLPDHPVSRGVRPFSINDEWYYHMRFLPEMAGVTPILTDIPPASTLVRANGPHSGNPTVRQAVARKNPQHMAWCRQRPDGGRGFGFTGGHIHWNWGNDNFRRLVLNAIVWTARGEVPAGGVPSETPTLEDLEANQDYPQPPGFNRLRVRKLLEEWNHRPASETGT